MRQPLDALRQIDIFNHDELSEAGNFRQVLEEKRLERRVANGLLVRGQCTFLRAEWIAVRQHWCVENKETGMGKPMLAAEHEQRNLERGMRNGPNTLAIVAAVLPVNPQIIGAFVKRYMPVTGKLPFFKNLADRLCKVMHGRARDAKPGPLGL